MAPSGRSQAGDARVASVKCNIPGPHEVPEHLDPSAVDCWRNTCPVSHQHKSVFPADPWLWQPAAAAWVWGVLKAAGGTLQAQELIQHLARLRGFSRPQAAGLRNRGLAVLEAFRLVEIERLPTAGGGGERSVYGNVKVVGNRIDKADARRRREQAEDDRWIEMLRQAVDSTEDRGGHRGLEESRI